MKKCTAANVPLHFAKSRNISPRDTGTSRRGKRKEGMHTAFDVINYSVNFSKSVAPYLYAIA